MAKAVIIHESEWREVSGRQPSTTTGPVRVSTPALVRCDECGKQWAGGGVHGARYNSLGILVDCVGREVPQ